MTPRQPVSHRSVMPLSAIGVARIVELAVRDVGLTSSQYRALSAIDVGVSSSGLIARFLDVTPSTVTALIDGLERDGLVRRNPDPSDRRRQQLALTEDGERVLGDANDRATDAITSLAGNLSVRSRDRALAGLVDLGTAIERQRDGW